jgi:hypothetical protein
MKAPNQNPREFAVYWRRWETDARTPVLAECEAKVREAWKLEKARPIAEKTANAFLDDKEIKGNPDGYRKLLDQKDFPSYTEKRFQRYELNDPLRRAGSVDYKLATPSAFFEYPLDDLVDRTLKDLQKPGDMMVVTNKPKSTYYVLFLRERRQPHANEEIWVRQFDQEVVYPEMAKQLKVDGRALSQWVAGAAAKKYGEEWVAYLKAATKYNPKQAEKLKSYLDNLSRGSGGGEDF